jgi:hypothetical protein
MLKPTTWMEIAPHDCEDLLRSCVTGRLVYTNLTLPAVQPTDFQLDGSWLLFLAPPQLRIAHGNICSFHVQADDATWTVTAHGPVDLQHGTLPQVSGAVGLERTPPVVVPLNEPLALDIQLLVGHRLHRQGRLG